MRTDLYYHMCLNCPSRVFSCEYEPISALTKPKIKVGCSRKTCTEIYEVFPEVNMTEFCCERAEIHIPVGTIITAKNGCMLFGELSKSPYICIKARYDGYGMWTPIGDVKDADIRANLVFPE